MLGYGDFVETSLSNEAFLSLRNLTHFRSYLVSCIGDLKRKSVALLDQVFPEYESTFSNIFGKTSKEKLKMLSSPSDFENLSTDKLNSILENIRAKILLKGKLTSCLR